MKKLHAGPLANALSLFIRISCAPAAPDTLTILIPKAFIPEIGPIAATRLAVFSYGSRRVVRTSITPGTLEHGTGFNPLPAGAGARELGISVTPGGRAVIVRC